MNPRAATRMASPGRSFTGGVAAIIILSVAVGCGDPGATEPDAVATNLSAASPLVLTAVAGTSVGDRPSVIVRDQRGAPMPGVSVTFAVTGGGGFLAGLLATTNSTGIATVGGWTLGPKVGANTLLAVSGSFTAVIFTANGIAGPPLYVVKNAGDNQTGLSGTAVLVPPSVTIKDANGNAVSGATVTFAVASGGGSVTGGISTSNSGGVATLGGWTLGPGTNTLSAEVSGVTPAIFTATAVSTPCSVSTPLALESVVPATLTASDCILSDGRPGHVFSVTVALTKAYQFFMQASFKDAHLTLFTKTWVPVAEHGSQAGVSHIKALLTPGEYNLVASSSVAGGAGGAPGQYTVSAQATPATVSQCEDVFVVSGLTIEETLSQNDCVSSEHFSDRYLIYLQAGVQVTITMDLGYDAALVTLYDSNEKLAAVSVNDYPGLYPAIGSLVFTPTSSGYYTIDASALDLHTVGGEYTLLIQ